jgi:uroporphyrinogen decarboxylase
VNGRQRVISALNGEPVDRLPIAPILHSALAPVFNVELDRYFTDASSMARVLAKGQKHFGLDLIQFSLGVAAEPEALGGEMAFPPGAAPMLKKHPLTDLSDVDRFRVEDIVSRGRFPMYHEAIRKLRRHVGDAAFVVSTLRGPLNVTSQLYGVENTLIALLEEPDAVQRVLDLSVDLTVDLARESLAAGADGLLFGEATASPNFIRPDMYRELLHPAHVRLVKAVRDLGWQHVGWHVCGDIRPIIPDLISTGADWLDVDYQVPPDAAIALSEQKVALRGNLDPVSVLFKGQPDHIREATRTLVRETANARWLLGSGCDIPPGTSEANLQAFAHAARQARKT